MKLKNQIYHQSRLIRYFVIVYLLLFVGFCTYLYLEDIGVNLFIVFMNLPIVILLYASFSRKVYIIIKDNQFEVYNSFKPRKFNLDAIKTLDSSNKNWIVHLGDNQKTNLTNMRVAEKDKADFQEQMKSIQTYLKAKNGLATSKS